MYCLQPLIRLNKEKKAIFKKYDQEFFSWKHFPAKDKLNYYLKNNFAWAYPCKSCLNCINMNRHHWVQKLELEKKNWKNTLFLTITYNNENYPGELKVKDVQKFIMYLRKYDKPIKYYCCGEYGGKTERAHYHMILFTNKDYKLELLKHTKTGPLFYCEEMEKKYWLNKGYIWVAHDFNSASFAYVASYSNKKFLKQTQNKKYKHFYETVHKLNTDDEYSHLSGWQKYMFIDTHLIPNIIFRKSEFIIMSKKPPIGSGYNKVNSNVPSNLLRWKKKNADTMEEFDEIQKELSKRQNDYNVYLQKNDVENIIYDNNVLFNKKSWQRLKKTV